MRVEHGHDKEAHPATRPWEQQLQQRAYDHFAGATLDRYIGYYEPYATSHDALDADERLQQEVRNVARSLVDGLALQREGKFMRTDGAVTDPRPK